MLTETTVRQLIEKLQAMPLDARVEFRLPKGRRYNGGDGFDPTFVEHEKLTSDPVVVITSSKVKKRLHGPAKVELTRNQPLTVIGDDWFPILRIVQAGRRIHIEMCREELSYGLDKNI